MKQNVAGGSSVYPILLKRYLRTPRVEPGEEGELWRRHRQGDKDARARLTENYLPVVVHVVRQFHQNGLTYEDMAQEGVIGLMAAIDKWDPEKGALVSYAEVAVQHAISEAIVYTAGEIRTSRRTSDKLITIAKATRELTAELARLPTEDEIAERTGIDRSQLDKLRAIPIDRISLDSPALMAGEEEDDKSLVGQLPDPEPVPYLDNVFGEALADIINEELRQLLPRYEKVIRLKYWTDTGQELTPTEIGRELGCSMSAAHKATRRALASLRRSKRLQELKAYL